jgi:hypothetical protein
MATITTHDLIQCSRIYPTLPSVNPVGLSPFNGLLVEFNNNPERSYRVRRNVQARFRHPSEYAGASSIIPGKEFEYSITSMKFNGVEILSAPANYTWDATNVEWTSFPLYTVGNEYLYTSNVANGVSVGVDLTGALGLGTNNFYKFLESIVDANDLPVKVSKSPGLWWAPEAFPRIINFILEKYYDDDFEFTMVETQTVGPSVVSQTNRYVFNGNTVLHTINGVNVVTYLSNVEWPQYSQLYSFLSYGYTYTTIEEIQSCPIFDPFNTSLLTDGCANIKVSCDCKKMTFADNSNYITNGLPGHDPELFTSRTIRIKKPNGSFYVYGTPDVANTDQVIQPHYSSSNQFSYQFTPNDVDGIYEITLCSYPDWNASVFYESFIQTIVRRNGKLYKVVSSNTNLDPSDPDNINYWVEYTCDVDCDDTRYCTTQKIAVLCISLLKCYKDLVSEAFCSMKKNPCKDICDNKEFINAMKFRVTLDGLEMAICSGQWSDAQDHIDILKSICCCNG